MADSQRKTANLFDKDTAPSLKLYINTRDAIIKTNPDTRLTYYPCKANTTYTVIKTAGTRFALATTVNTPVANEPLLNSIADNTADVLSITTPSTAVYLVVWYWINTDTITEEQMRDSIMIVESSTAPSSYEPYGWVHSLRKLGTSTDTLTTLPADIYANDTTATVGLKGQMVQSSTPSPTTPIPPSECGERTENLCDIDDISLAWAYTSTSMKNTLNQLSEGSYVLTFKSTLTSRNDTSDTSLTGFIAISSVSGANISSTQLWQLKDVGDFVLITANITITSETKGNYTNAYFYGCGINNVGATGSAIISDIMLNSGSTALPFEPYGVKIPISSGGTTTPVYLGEMESTRRIKKLVLDGSEDWAAYSSIADCYRLGLQPNSGITGNGLCSHFEKVETTARLTNGTFVSGQNYSYFKDTTVENLSGWKSYLQQQYAAGTPVCVWYVLATETTGIVNEPIRKIGDYADTVSGITIPTIAGKDSFDVLTTLKPSEVSLAYTGWHGASVKEWDGEEWQ